MRIKSLWIENWKNLIDFRVNFDESFATTVIVGRNGTGKSNLLEALTLIFRDLDLGEPTTFAYRIEYVIRGSIIKIENRPSNRLRRPIWVDGRRASLSALRGDNAGRRLLPDFVFGYYSGPTNRLQEHFQKHQNNFNRALREGEDRPLRRLFYARPEHSQFVLLAFFLGSGDPSVQELLAEYLRIVDFESALFVAATPPWRTRTQGHPEFWNARGAVATLLDELYRLSLAPMRLPIGMSGPSGMRRKTEHVYLYLDDLAKLSELAARYGGQPARLFAAFESILAADLLFELRVRVKIRGMDGSLTFRELSEGEQQLLMVLGLLRFTRGEESLFLLDEPDTHLNPAWGLRYTEMLGEQSGPGLYTSQILMASHDPLVISSLLAPQVCLLERDASTGVVRAQRPATDPQGMGVSALLTSEIYGLASELDPITFTKLERRRWLAAADELSGEELAELARLTEELESKDFVFSDRDPIYAKFEKAMTTLEREAETSHSAATVRAEEARGLERLRSILAEESSAEAERAPRSD